MKFRSKIDLWLGTLIVVVAVIVFRVAYSIALKPYGFVEAFPLVAIGAALPLWVLASTSYDVINANLWIRSGPFKWKISILSISKIEPTTSWVSSPALSVNRLKIEYGKGKTILISPNETDKFLHVIRESIARGSRY